MKSCTFFGHRDTKKEIEPTIESTLLHLIEKENVDMFYIGNNGNFDTMVQKVLISLKSIYSNINYFIVFAYTTEKGNMTNAIYPVSIESSFSPIPARNKWMIEHSDVIVTYVTKVFGGAANCKRYAISKGKRVIELSKL